MSAMLKLSWAYKTDVNRKVSVLGCAESIRELYFLLKIDTKIIVEVHNLEGFNLTDSKEKAREFMQSPYSWATNLYNLEK